MGKWVISLLILLVLVTVDIPALRTLNDPCRLNQCPDSPGFSPIVDMTPPNFYVPAGLWCGIACFDRPAYIDWNLFAFDLVTWLVLSGIVFKYSNKKGKEFVR